MRFKCRKLLLLAVGCILVVSVLLTLKSHQPTKHTTGQFVVNRHAQVSYQPIFNDTRFEKALLEQSQRQQHLNTECSRILQAAGNNSSFHGWDREDDMLVDDTRRYIYCPVGKVATRSWKFVLLRAAGSRVAMNKADNKHIIAKYLHQLRSYVDEPGAVDARLEHYYKFFVVREPMERFVSAYNYIFGSSSYFQMHLGRGIIRRYRPNATQQALSTGRFVSIAEFARYVLDENAAGNRHDRHWRPQHILCHPCHIRYNVIGHFETIMDDAAVILAQLGIPETVVRFPTQRRRPHTSTSKARHTLKKIPASDRRKLIDMYRHDYELFNFTIDKELLSDEIINDSNEDE